MYASYDEGTYCNPGIMRGVLYARCDERAYCTPGVMRGVLYASYVCEEATLVDDFTYFFTPQSVLHCWFTILAKYSRNVWSLFGANIG